MIVQRQAIIARSDPRDGTDTCLLVFTFLFIQTQAQGDAFCNVSRRRALSDCECSFRQVGNHLHLWRCSHGRGQLPCFGCIGRHKALDAPCTHLLPRLYLSLQGHTTELASAAVSPCLRRRMPRGHRHHAWPKEAHAAPMGMSRRSTCRQMNVVMPAFRICASCSSPGSCVLQELTLLLGISMIR